MKRFLLLLMLICCGIASSVQAALTPDREYYIWLNIYEKLLGNNAAADAPALSAFGTDADADSYVFIAEDSGKSGYVLLRQKSSGRYLAASSANNWSMVFESNRSTDDRFCWKTDEGTYTYLVNKKNSKYVGVDGAGKGSDYVAIYYNKPRGSHSQFSVIPVAGATWNEARAAYVSDVYTNAQGIREIDYCLVKDMEINRSDTIDIHITANERPIQGSSKINLGSHRTWLILDNIEPSAAASYLSYVTINGRKASNGTNCRIAIYLNGTVIMPLIDKKIMKYHGTAGDFTLYAENNSTLSTRNNTMESFVLQRGYMATIATGQGGTGYSRVYVADHDDLEITLPEALARRVSSVNIKPWQYISKKGWADTGGATKGPSLRATWFWSWSAGYSSTSDMEYVPCRQHKSWPTASEVNNKTSSAAFSINEPEHSEQHTSDKCSCGGTVDSWYCTTITPDFLAGGGRIGSPQPTDFSWMYDYFGHVNDMAYRCDFAVTHAYWDISSRSEADYATWFTSHCKEVWTNTGRPLWITELEIGSSWGEKVTSYDTYRKYLLTLLQKMEECDWIERYAIYDYDVYTCYMFYRDDNWNRTSLTPAGQVYRDHRSTFAYHADYTKEPLWWAPSAKHPSITVKQNSSTGKFTFIISNPNTDMTDELYVERLMDDGTWQEVARETKRSVFDDATITITGIVVEGASADTDQFRVTVKTLKGVVISSTSGLIENPAIEASSKDVVEGWTLTREADNGYTKSTGDTYFEVWDATAAKMNFNYYQDITNLTPGIYRLTANVFNTTDGVIGATVNGAAGLYAQTPTQLYFAPVTEDAIIVSDATTLDGIPQYSIDRILVGADGNLRVGVRNLGAMSARWAGADNFLLTCVQRGFTKSDSIENSVQNATALYALMPSLADDTAAPASPYATPRDASRFIVNPDCNRATSYGWTTSNVSTKADAEAYDGVASNTYWNLWKSGAFTSALQQEVTGLPEGTYTFSAMLRGQSTALLTLSAVSTGDTSSQPSSVSITGTNLISDEGSGLSQGWHYVTTPPIHVAAGNTLTLALDVNASATAWWSADHFTLTLLEIPETITGIAAMQPATTTTRADIFDLAGRKVSTRDADSRQLQKGIYIINGRKILIQ